MRPAVDLGLQRLARVVLPPAASLIVAGGGAVVLHATGPQMPLCAALAMLAAAAIVTKVHLANG